jgi:hypothetical protein
MRTRTGDLIETVKQDVLGHSHVVEQCTEGGHDDLPKRIRAEPLADVTVGTTAAGYGWAHQQQARTSWGSLVATGKVRCAPSGEPIQPREHRRNSHDHHR